MAGDRDATMVTAHPRHMGPVLRRVAGLAASPVGGRYRAREASGDERERLWRLAADYYPGYDTYQDRTGGRRIPVMVLER